MSPSKWDTFDATVRRLHDDFEFTPVEVTNSTRVYDNEDAEWTYTPVTPRPTVDAEMSDPGEPDISRGTDGSQVEIDLEMWIRDDAGVTIVEMGAENDQPTELTDTATGKTYRVQDQFREGNGLLKLQVVEV